MNETKWVRGIGRLYVVLFVPCVVIATVAGVVKFRQDALTMDVFGSYSLAAILTPAGIIAAGAAIIYAAMCAFGLFLGAIFGVTRIVIWIADGFRSDR